MLKKPLNDEWRAWIRLNVARGCSRDELARILLNEGFDFVEVGTELGLTAGSSPAASLPPRLQRDTGPKAAVLTGLQRHGEPLLELYTADQFLDARTCKALVELIKASLRPSTISSQGAHPRAEPLLELYTADQFLDARTCKALVELIKASLRPSTISSQGAPEAGFRTSRTCDLDERYPVVR